MSLRWMFSSAGSEQRESRLPQEKEPPGHREGQSRRARLLAGILLITERALCQGLCEPILLIGNGGLESIVSAPGHAARKWSTSQTGACAIPKHMFFLFQT